MLGQSRASIHAQADELRQEQWALCSSEIDSGGRAVQFVEIPYLLRSYELTYGPFPFCGASNWRFQRRVESEHEFYKRMSLPRTCFMIHVCGAAEVQSHGAERKAEKRKQCEWTRRINGSFDIQ